MENLKERGENEILPGIRPVGLGLFIEKERILVIADLHLGYEEMLNAQGVFIPRINSGEIKKKLGEMLSELPELKRIVIAGDLKHEFGRISKQEWREVIEMAQFLARKCREVVLLRGNHDTILGPLAKWEKLKIRDDLYITSSSMLVLHGHEFKENANFRKAKTLVIAHEHPALSLREGIRSELYKCFLKGKFGGKNLIVLPSLNSISTGTNVLREKLLSPFLKEADLHNFECWLVEDRAYYFGGLGEMNP